MPAGRPQAPRGTLDVLPDEGARRLALQRLADEVLSDYPPVETPVFESTELFERGVGETTDIVEKEMFTFEDQGGRSISLRPEGTAGVCRAYLEHGMHKWPQPVKMRYWGPFFRYEAPQAGRYRQFTQVGIEAIGSDDPSLDAETILRLSELLDRARVARPRLRVSSLGTPATRREYSDELRDYLRARADQLSDDVRARLDRNPLRAFDSDHPGTREAIAGAPRLLDRLAPEDADHFARVRELLDAEGQEYEVDPTLVRGLDYYTRTVFEFSSDALGAQSQLGGGGRYDGLIEQLGGPPTPGVGFAAGVERILLAGELEAEPAAPRVYVVDPAAGTGAFLLAAKLRANGVPAAMEQAGRSMKGQLKQANRLGVRWVAIVGEDGIELKDMESGEQRAVESEDALLEAVR